MPRAWFGASSLGWFTECGHSAPCAHLGGVAGPAFDSPAFPLAPHRSPELVGFCMSEVSMHNLRAALTATIDTIRMGIKLWRTAKRREREAGRQ